MGDDSVGGTPPPIQRVTDPPDVGELLCREPHRFEFFQAVRLLERLSPSRTPVGRDEHPGEEVVRFRAHVALAFPASEIVALTQPPGDAAPPELWTSFLGLAGVVGALPHHYTNLIADPSRRRETAPLRAFLDIFNHRLLSFFYRAWEKYRYPIAYERTGRDDFSQYLLCFIGMGSAGLQGRLAISEQILLYYAGPFTQRPRSATALEGILEDYFDVRVRVTQFRGERFLMNPETLSTLGALGQHNRLGVDAVLHEQVWDPQAGFRISLGPLTWQQFQEFIPSGAAYRSLVELTRFFTGEEFGFDIQPILRADEVPRCVLGGGVNTRLGWSSWLVTRAREEDAAQPLVRARVPEA